MDTYWIKIPGRPRSAQGSKNREYRELVECCAKKACPKPMKGDLSVCLFYVFEDISGRNPDLDNLNKLFLDAIKGIAYADDSQVHVSRSERHFCGKTVVSLAPIMPPAHALQEAVELKKEECTFIGVTDAQL